MLSKVLASLQSHLYINLVVVNNGSDTPVGFYDECTGFASCHVITNPQNMGSAFAYAQALQYVYSTNPKGIVFLLDDDNFPDPSSITTLISKLEEFENLKGEGNVMCLAYRPSRRYLRKLIEGESLNMHFASGNDFLGFSAKKIIQRFISPERKQRGTSDVIKLPYGPYGGLMFHVSLINMIGLPDERFFVYGDDFDFTARFVASGGAIFLIENAIVNDLEDSWQKTPKKSIFKPAVLYGSHFRIYYAVRNYVYFQRQRLVRSTLIYGVNASVYILFLFLLSVLTFRLKHFAVFVHAVMDGFIGDFDNTKYKI